jgi:hypothetical protein
MPLFRRYWRVLQLNYEPRTILYVRDVTFAIVGDVDDFLPLQRK